MKFHKARIAEKLGVKTPAEIALRLSGTANNKLGGGMSIKKLDLYKNSFCKISLSGMDVFD